MAWRVALVLDTETDLNVAIGELPIWAQTTEKRRSYPAKWRERWNLMWHPDPGFTLITTPPAKDLEKGAAEFLPVLADHHPNLYCVYLFGVPESERLIAAMADFGYYPTPLRLESGLVFARPLKECQRKLLLDASTWDTNSEWKWEQCFYDAFFAAVGAPLWHGRNFDALADSIDGGGINQIEVPYKIVIQSAPLENPFVARFLSALSDLTAILQARGCPVQLQVKPEIAD